MRDHAKINNRIAIAFLFGIIIIVASFILSRYPIEFSKFAKFGYIGVFLVSALGSAPLFFPIPHPATVFAGGVLFNPFGVAIAGGLGGTIGEMVGYSAGFGGRFISKDVWVEGLRGSFKSLIGKIIDKITEWVGQYPRITIFVLALIPNPFFDVAGIVAGFNRYSFGNFFIATLFGKTLRSFILAYLGSRYGSTLLEESMKLVYFAILFIALPLSVLFTSLFARFAKKEFPPFLPELNTHSFAQAIIIVVAALTFEGSFQGIGLTAFFLLLIILLLVVFQALLDQAKKEKTEAHISKILAEKVRPHLKEKIDFEKIKDIGFSLVEEDFIPDSRTQKWSGYPRRTRRQQLADLINNHFCSELAQPLSETDFLVPEQETRTFNILYFLINSLSVLFYAVIVFLYINILNK